MEGGERDEWRRKGGCEGRKVREEWRNEWKGREDVREEKKS